MKLARDLRSEDDPAATAQVVCDTAVAWIGGDVLAGITLVHRRRHIETIAATSEVACRGDELQYELGEGPCLDAAWQAQHVHSRDLASEPRWPTWAPRVAGELDVKSMLCTQMFTNEDTLGALNLYSRSVDAFSDEDQDTSLVVAAHGAVAVAAAQEIESLNLAVDRRTAIGKAIGIVMERFQISDDRAFQLLARLSSHENRKMYDIATELASTGHLPLQHH